MQVFSILVLIVYFFFNRESCHIYMIVFPITYSRFMNTCLFGSRGKTTLRVYSNKSSSHAGARSCRVRRLNTRHGNRRRDDRGENGHELPSAIWRFPMSVETRGERGHVAISKTRSVSPMCRRKPRLISSLPFRVPSLFLSSLLPSLAFRPPVDV